MARPRYIYIYCKKCRFGSVVLSVICFMYMIGKKGGKMNDWMNEFIYYATLGCHMVTIRLGIRK